MEAIAAYDGPSRKHTGGMISALDNLRYFLKLIRWFHGLLGLFPFVALYFIIDYHAQKNGQAQQVSGTDFILLCICVQLLMAVGFIWNDWRDWEIDKINKPNTHIVGRKLSLHTVKLLFSGASVAAIALSAYISVYIFAEWAWISSGVYLISIAYSVWLKRSPLFGNIAIALLAAFVPLTILFFAKDAVAALHNEKIVALVYAYAILMFVIVVPRELSLDISDMDGDKADGCRTLPIVIGVKKSRAIVVIMLVSIILLSPLVMYAYPWFTLTLVLVDVLLIAYLFQFRKSHTRMELIRAGRFLWFILIAGIIGCTICSLI